MAERASTERSVERALDLLEELARWPYGVTLADITAESGLE